MQKVKYETFHRASLGDLDDDSEEDELLPFEMLSIDDGEDSQEEDAEDV